MSAGALNSSILFLKSKNDKHPKGLANSNDLIGRNLMLHNNSVFIALSKSKNNSLFGKTIGVNKYYFANDEEEFPLGHIQMLGKIDDVIVSNNLPSFIPNFISKLIAEHTIDFWITTEDLPLYENRVELKDNNKVKVFYKRTNLKSHNKLIKKLASYLNDIGCFPFLYKTQLMGIDKTSHQCGTMRFGNDKHKSVLDINCKVHDLDNVYVVDSSFFVTSSSVNPALTIIANAIRISEHIKKHVI